jgi:hypothetical protein
MEFEESVLTVLSDYSSILAACFTGLLKRIVEKVTGPFSLLIGLFRIKKKDKTYRP